MVDTAPLALLQARILPPSDLGSNLQLGLRWVHLVAGITWIGLLFFFNLVLRPAMQALEAPTRARVIPLLFPRALEWFRWSGLVTVLAGFAFWVLILETEPRYSPGAFTWVTVGNWLLEVILTWIALYLLLQVPPLLRYGWLFGAVVILLVALFCQHFLNHNLYSGASNRMVSIGLGGGIGLLLLLNVWGIVWPAEKRLIAWTREHAARPAPPPPELARKLRRAFLAARASFWLAWPMLFLMAAASHYPLFVRLGAD